MKLTTDELEKLINLIYVQQGLDKKVGSKESLSSNKNSVYADKPTDKLRNLINHHKSEMKRHFLLYEKSKSKKQLIKHLRHKFIAEELEKLNDNKKS